MQKKTNLLLIDDNSSLQKVFQKHFCGDEFNLTFIVEPNDFFGLNHNEFDLIITDMIMPNYSGIDLLTFVRSKGLITPIIMITAYSSMSLVLEFMKQGGDDFIEKPILFDVLKLKVKNAIANKKTGQDLKKIQLNDLFQSEAQIIRRELFTSIFHELFKPLNSIISFSNKGLTKFDQISNEIKNSYFDKIQLSSEIINAKICHLFESNQTKHQLLGPKKLTCKQLIDWAFDRANTFLGYELIKDNLGNDYNITIAKIDSYILSVSYLIIAIQSHKEFNASILVKSIQPTNNRTELQFKFQFKEGNSPANKSNLEHSIVEFQHAINQVNNIVKYLRGDVALEIEDECMATVKIGIMEKDITFEESSK